jgi:hypothetical protein
MTPMMAAAYACSTDTFTGGDASAEGGGGGVSSNDFCDAEAHYFRACGEIDAACIQQDLQHCADLYGDLTSGFATAVAYCMNEGGLACNTELGNAAVKGCLASQLIGYQNDSGVLANFANDFCAKCDPNSPTCAGKFASQPDQPGYLPSMFNDKIIQSMDDCLKQYVDAAPITKDDSGACLAQSVYCEAVALKQAGPPEACGDP